MVRVEPYRIEYCSLSGEQVSDPVRCQEGGLLSVGECVATAETCLATYWRNEGGTLQRTHKVKPYPEMVRVMAKDGKEICRVSIDDAIFAAFLSHPEGS
jgi:hypothetical protein